MRRRPPLMVVLGAGAVLVSVAAGACGSSAPGAVHTATTVHVALPAGADPSRSARMVCSPEAQRALASTLGLPTVAPVTPTWSDHLYSCRYVYRDGVIAVSVKELDDKAQTTSYFHDLGTRLGDTGVLSGLGQGAFTTTDGSAVVRKDYKVLLVDVSGLPPQFGVPPTSAADVAVTVSDLIMGCWTGA